MVQYEVDPVAVRWFFIHGAIQPAIYFNAKMFSLERTDVSLTTNASRTERERSLIIALAVLGVFVTYVPITGVSVSLAAIGQATGASNSDLQWVSDAYVIPMAAAVLSAGVFGDRHGRRRVFTGGMVLTFVGALVAALASLLDSAAIPVLWTGQAISGVGAGMLLPTTLALIAHAVPDFRERSRYVGMWATGIVAGLAIGPLLSGVILEYAGWGWLYAPIIVLALATAVLAHIRLPESKSSEVRHLDWPGQITATIAIAASIYGVIEGGEHGWTSPTCLAGLAVGIAAVVAFVLLERRAEKPLMDLKLFRSAAFSAASISALVALFAVVGTMFLLSLFLGQVQQLSPLDIGLRLVFVTGVSAVLNPFVSRLMKRVAPIILLVIGLIVAAFAVLLLTGLTAETSFVDLAWRLVILGAALALMLSSVSVVAINSAPWQLAGMAAATATAFRQYGGALGPAVLGSVYVGALVNGDSASEGIARAMVVCSVTLLVAAVACVVGIVVTRRSVEKSA